MKSWTAALLLLALTPACAALERAAGEVGEKGTAVGAATGLGLLAWLAHPAGWIGAALAAFTGALAALMFGGGDTTVHEAPRSPWPGLALVVAGVLVLRSWAHWLPPLLEVLKRTAKGTPRALLGGRARDPQAPRFRRRAD